MLGMVASALSANGIDNLHLEGSPMQRAKQISRFQTSPNLTVFLLSLRNDNSGLTLVSATAVFLMEPSLNRAVEAQAISRIHRIGQTRETHVYKFLMRNSVEQHIDTMTATTDERDDEQRGRPTEDGDQLLQQSHEAMSVPQLLKVLGLADDQREEGPSNEEAS
jgi:E3 ubiquitin-protein ligase SHPRH